MHCTSRLKDVKMVKPSYYIIDMTIVITLNVVWYCIKLTDDKVD